MKRLPELLATVSGWQETPRDGVTGHAALWTMFRTYKARYGPPECRITRAMAAAGHSRLLAADI